MLAAVECSVGKLQAGPVDETVTAAAERFAGALE